MNWIKEKRERTKKILKELRKTKTPSKVIQVDFKKREVVGEFIYGEFKNDKSKVI